MIEAWLPYPGQITDRLHQRKINQAQKVDRRSLKLDSCCLVQSAEKEKLRFDVAESFIIDVCIKNACSVTGRNLVPHAVRAAIQKNASSSSEKATTTVQSSSRMRFANFDKRINV